MHNRSRVKHRISISDIIQHNVSQKETRSIKASINNLLGTEIEPTSLHVLKIDDNLLHDEIDIHNALTSQFHHHFETPVEHSAGIHSTEQWSSILSNRRQFFAHAATHKVPNHLTKIIWSAMHIHKSKPSNLDKARQEIEQQLSQPPTLQEFTQSIRRAPKGSSPGLSGLSYSILSVLSPPTVLYIYTLLSNMWASKYQPEWWKWRWLSVIPKTPNPTVAQFRPIMLLESTRKLWTGIVARKISHIWEKYDILHPSQFGARPKLSTYSNLLQTISTLEINRHLKHELFIGCWDLKKAFDCPSKPVLKMAWNRLGVPEEVAEWLVSIDEAGPTIVRTPASIDSWNKRGYAGFTEYDPLLPSSETTIFRAQRGTR